MLTLFFAVCVVVVVWVESFMCVSVMKCVFATTFIKENFFSTSYDDVSSVETKIVCYVLKRFYVKIRLSLKKGSLCSN